MEYYPTRPNNPYQDDCRPKPDCGCTPPPTVCPPQKPPVCQPPQPVMGQIPPVPTVIEGSSLYEAMGKVIERTNMCSDTSIATCRSTEGCANRKKYVCQFYGLWLWKQLECLV